MSQTADAADEPFGDDPQTDPGPRRRRARTSADVEVEREHTTRALIEAITRLVVVVLYMVFTLVRERDAGVVALDPADDDVGPEDDWAEA